MAGGGAEGQERQEGLFAREARNPQKPAWLMMGCHTLFTPSSHAANSVTLDGKPPTPPPNNVRKRRRAEESSGNNKLWYYCSHEGLAQSGNTSLFLAVLESSHHSCTAGILLRTFCDTHTHTLLCLSLLSFFYTPSHSLTHSHVPLC